MPANPPRDYVFYTTCVASVGVLINEMQAQARDVTYETMLAHCVGLLDEAVNLGYEKRSTTGHGLTLKNDWSISYHHSKYCGVPCYYFVWSHIEHVWIRPQDHDAVAACEERARDTERGRTSLRARDNPLSPTAHSRESAPCALAKPPGCGLAFDDRAGVHVTDDWGLALRYAAFKAARSASVAVILTYDMKGLELVPDFDAQVEKAHSGIGELSYYIKEFDILTDPDSPDYDRLADILDGERAADESDGPPWSAQAELVRLSKTPIEHIIADHLRGKSMAEAREALEGLAAKDLPLEYYAEVIHQRRTFSEVGDDRLLRVEVVKPFFDTVDDAEDPEELDECPMRLLLEDLNDIPSAVEKVELWARQRPRSRPEVYYHGTDLTRARQILKGLVGADTGLINPWAPCVQPED